MFYTVRVLTILVIFGASAAFAAAMPEEIEKQLSERLPAAFVPIPASGATKIFPLVSDKRKSPDRKYAITVDGTPFAITAIGDGGKLVEMSVPAGLHTEEFTNRWFKAEDVFGKIKWKLEPYTPEVPCLAYLSGGKGPLELVAKICGEQVVSEACAGPQATKGRRAGEFVYACLPQGEPACEDASRIRRSRKADDGGTRFQDGAPMGKDVSVCPRQHKLL